MFNIEKNLAVWDRGIRVLVAFFMIGVGVAFSDWIGEPILQWVIIIFGALNLFAAVFGWCPVYHLGRISTRNRG